LSAYLADHLATDFTYLQLRYDKITVIGGASTKLHGRGGEMCQGKKTPVETGVNVQGVNRVSR
jgi:hypothetical protein